MLNPRSRCGVLLMTARLDGGYHQVSRAGAPLSQDPQPLSLLGRRDLPDHVPLAAQNEVRPVRPDAIEDVRGQHVARQDRRAGDLETYVLPRRAELQVGPLAPPLGRRADVAVDPETVEARSHTRARDGRRQDGGEHGDPGDEPTPILHRLCVRRVEPDRQPLRTTILTTTSRFPTAKVSFLVGMRTSGSG